MFFIVFLSAQVLDATICYCYTRLETGFECEASPKDALNVSVGSPRFFIFLVITGSVKSGLRQPQRKRKVMQSIAKYLGILRVSGCLRLNVSDDYDSASRIVLDTS